MSVIRVTTFYKFVKLTPEVVAELKSRLCTGADEYSVSGLVILGQEGVNATISAAPDNLNRFKELLLSIPEFKDMLFKDSSSDRHPFKRFKVKVRPEIVTLDNTELVPSGKNNHLSPSAFKQMLEQDPDITLIDTRNWYEVELGKFEGAVDPRLEMFNEFPDFVSKLRIPKDKKVLMYCTGGIRCEKAILEMQRQGFKNVYQLEGGILKYLEEYPNDKFLGECFVFDHRVAVKQDLAPSEKWELCPLCGNPGGFKLAECRTCSKPAVICQKCADSDLLVCSKNCRHHYLLKKSAARLNEPTVE